MSLPLVGVGLPAFEPHASPEAIATVATTAERLGFNSVAVGERLLFPATLGWSNDYGLPESAAYDALETLTWVAAHTKRVRLITGVLIPLFQPPIVLARRLATLDQLSSGRVVAGVALGWLPEEFAAVGVPLAGRAANFEEHLAVMRACWAPDPVEHDGPRFHIPRSKIGPKPVTGHLPVLIGGVARAAVERAARLGDGFIMGFRNWKSTCTQIDWYRGAGGTGPIVLRAGPMLADAEHPTPPTTWTESSVIDDLDRAARAGVDEVIWDLNIVGLEPQRQIEVLEALAAKLKM